MKKIIWKILERIDSNWGYSTPLQKRFERGQMVQINQFKAISTPYEIDAFVFIVEEARHDYLVRDKMGLQHCVLNFEIDKIKK